MANVLYERVGATSLLTIDRPERRNAIDGQTAEELLAGYRSFESDENAHVLVVTGSGEEAFSAGADLKAIETLGSRVDSAEPARLCVVLAALHSARPGAIRALHLDDADLAGRRLRLAGTNRPMGDVQGLA
jgi:enoyl-CoA hydratase/carnithine racemase